MGDEVKAGEQEERELEVMELKGRVLPGEVMSGADVVRVLTGRGEGVKEGRVGRGEGGKAGVKLTEREWGLLVGAYRELPGGHSAAARAAGVNIETARRGWERGFGYAPWGQVPIKKMLEVEQRDARALIQKRYTEEAAAKLQEEIEREREATKQAVEARADEGMALQFGRKATKQALAAVTSTMPGLRMLAERVNETLRVQYGEGKPMTLAGAREAMALIEKSAVTIRHLAGATESLIEAERRFMGEPGKRGVVLVMTLEEAKQELERAKRLAEAGVDSEETREEIDLTKHRFTGT